MEPGAGYNRKAVLETFRVIYAIEMEISRLYSIFAAQFPEENSFWKKTSAEEVTHADNIKRIIMLIAENQLEYKIGKAFSHKAAMLILENIKLYVSDANEKLLSKAETLIIARGLEISLLEAEYMDYLITDNKEYNDFIKQIIKEETQHKNLIETKYKEYFPQA